MATIYHKTDLSIDGTISSTNLSGTNTGDNAVNTLYSGLASSKQDTLISGTNIKTINGSSILGSGNLTIGGSPTVLTLSGDVSTGPNTNPVDLTGMVFSYDANSTYIFEMYMFTGAKFSGTGHGFQLNTSTGISKIGMNFYHQLATTGTLTGGSSVADDLSLGVSSGVPNTSSIFSSGNGILVTTVNSGTAQFRFRSETTAVTVCRAGSTILVTKIA